MTDIVERLRLDAEPTEGDMEEAATEIERLREALHTAAVVIRRISQMSDIGDAVIAADAWLDESLRVGRPLEDRWDNE